MVDSVSLSKMFQEAEEAFTTGFMCSETVLSVLDENYELDMGSDAIAMSTGFPYGFGDGGNVCGAVAGATMALGKVFGRSVKGDPSYEKCINLVRELNDKIAKDYKTSICPELIADYDFAEPSRKVYCTGIVKSAIKAFAEIMNRELNITITM